MSKQRKLNEISSLDHYISLLLQDDKALELFLVSPEKAEKHNNITKAERAVLRRVVSGLSNKSKNGFSIRRDYASYRRSLRLLQNVLHKHSSEHLITQKSSKTGNTTYVSYIRIYFTGTTATPGAPVDQPDMAYNTYVGFYGLESSGEAHPISESMYFVAPSNPSAYTVSNPYTTKVPSSAGIISQYGDVCTLSYQSIYQNGEWYVIAFTVGGSQDSRLQNGTYKLIPEDNTTRVPFWYYSADGNAIVADPSKTYGYGVNSDSEQGLNGQSFTTFDITDSQTIIWQAIAPDYEYGYGYCFDVQPDFSRKS